MVGIIEIAEIMKEYVDKVDSRKEVIGAWLAKEIEIANGLDERVNVLVNLIKVSKVSKRKKAIKQFIDRIVSLSNEMVEPREDNEEDKIFIEMVRQRDIDVLRTGLPQYREEIDKIAGEDAKSEEMVLKVFKGIREKYLVDEKARLESTNKEEREESIIDYVMRMVEDSK